MAKVTKRVYENTPPPAGLSHPGLDIRIVHPNEVVVFYDYYWDVAHKEWCGSNFFSKSFPENGYKQGDTVEGGGVITDVTIN